MIRVVWILKSASRAIRLSCHCIFILLNGYCESLWQNGMINSVRTRNVTAANRLDKGHLRLFGQQLLAFVGLYFSIATWEREKGIAARRPSFFLHLIISSSSSFYVHCWTRASPRDLQLPLFCAYVAKILIIALSSGTKGSVKANDLLFSFCIKLWSSNSDVCIN